MKKRGQLSIFIILGILIVIIISIAGYFYISKDSSTTISTSEPWLKEIKIMFDDCLEQTSEEGIYEISAQGGYYQEPKYSIPFIEGRIPFYYYNSKTWNPTNTEITDELEDYVIEKIPSCLNNIKNMGYEIKYDKPDMKITLNDENVIVDWQTPIKITKEDKVGTIEESNVIITSKLKPLLVASRMILEDYEENRGFVCIGCFDDYFESKKIRNDVLYIPDIYNKNIILHSISDIEDNFLNLTLMFVVEE